MKSTLIGGVVAFSAISATAQANLPLDSLTLPDGFSISIYASDVENARQMALAEDGTLFVGSRSAGKVHAVLDTDKDGSADKVLEIASGLNMPSGIAYRDGDLYVAEISRVLRYANVLESLNDTPQPTVVIDGLPSDRHHGWKYIDFDPQGWLYVPVGAPCNICDPADPYSTIYKYNLSTGEKQLVAKGVRNSVGFDWNPDDGDFWFSDNGRDMMGDDIPPCEINHVSENGQHFGYPHIHGSDVIDPEFGQGKSPDQFRLPALNIQAHSAPLGIQFYRGDRFPAEYQDALIVAEHGSWNRSSKVGYQVMVAFVKDDKITDYQPLVQGWLQPGDEVWGRPSAIINHPDGSILIADDYANVVYKVSYQQP